VLNLGVGGYGTAQQLLYLEEEGVRYRPNLVVLAFYLGNDVQNNSRALEAGVLGEDAQTTFARPYAQARALDAELEWTPPDPARMAPVFERWQRRKGSLDAVRRALQPAMVVNVLKQAAGRLLRGAVLGGRYDPAFAFGWPFLREVPDPEVALLWEDAWLVTRRLLLEMDRVARGAGAGFVVLLVPADFQVDPRALAAIEATYPDVAFDPLHINRELATFAAQAGIPLLDPTAALAREQTAGRPMYYAIEDRHWNAAGHALATELLAAFLDERGLLPAR